MKLEIKSNDISARLNKALADIKGIEGKAGWFEKSKYPNGTPVAYVAIIQEKGSPPNRIPPRPYIAPTISRDKEIWAKIAESESRKILEGKQTAYNAMDILVQKAAAGIRQSITEVVSPPLKPATIRARLKKRSDKKTIGLLTKPLEDTGVLRGTCIGVVENDTRK